MMAGPFNQTSRSQGKLSKRPASVVKLNRSVRFRRVYPNDIVLPDEQVGLPESVLGLSSCGCVERSHERPLFGSTRASLLVNRKSRLAGADTEYPYVLAWNIVAGQGIDHGVHCRIVRPNSPVNHNVPVVIDGRVVRRSCRRVQGNMGEFLVPILLVIGMVGCLVQKRLAMQALEAWYHEAFDRGIQDFVAKNLEKLVLEDGLIMLGFENPARKLGQLPHAGADGEDPFACGPRVPA